MFDITTHMMNNNNTKINYKKERKKKKIKAHPRLYNQIEDHEQNQVLR
jgi:hypothetical protein